MKKTMKIIGLIIVALAAYYVWHVHFNYRFEEISEGKVYKSALIKNKSTMEKLLVTNNIKTVIDLLDPGVQDRLNPAKQEQIDTEDRYIKEINKDNNLNIKHVNIPSGQVPSKENLKKFFEVLDDESNYPILIHCYHGTGRAQMYSALYRIEKEGYSNADARSKTRVVVEGFGYRSSFSSGREKGDFLINYKKREN
jgi:protein-tyrosine phosphatase